MSGAERGPAGLGPLLVEFGSRAAADAVGPYELARIFAAFPMTTTLPSSSAGVPERVHVLAVTAALAKICSGWVGLDIHRALVAGADLDTVARAVGEDLTEVERRWREWADGQVALKIAGRPLLERAEYERVARRFTEATH